MRGVRSEWLLWVAVALLLAAVALIGCKSCEAQIVAAQPYSYAWPQPVVVQPRPIVVQPAPVLVQNPGVSNADHALLADRVVRRLEGVVIARAYSLHEYNIPRDRLAEAERITPGFKSPTVNFS